MPEKLEDADDTKDNEAPVPSWSQLMDTVDLLRWFAGARRGTEGTLNALVGYEKGVRPLLAKHT